MCHMCLGKGWGLFTGEGPHVAVSRNCAINIWGFTRDPSFFCVPISVQTEQFITLNNKKWRKTPFKLLLFIFIQYPLTFPFSLNLIIPHYFFYHLCSFYCTIFSVFHIYQYKALCSTCYHDLTGKNKTSCMLLVYSMGILVKVKNVTSVYSFSYPNIGGERFYIQYETCFVFWA